MAYVLIDTYYGSFETNGSYYFCKIYSQQNIAANTSDVKADVYIQYHTYGSYNLSPLYTTINIVGSSANVSTTGWNTDSNHNAQLIATRTITGISHNADGTKSISLNMSYDSEVSLGIGTITEAAIALPTIPRGSVIGTISDFNVEDGCSVPLTKYSESFTDTLVIKIGDTTIKTIEDYTNGAAIVFTESELIAIYAAIEDIADTFTFQITTYSGVTEIGDDSSTATGTIIGNGHLKVGGMWKNAIYYLKVSGVWKKTLVYLKASEVWKLNE
jgi:hypothetical protein